VTDEELARRRAAWKPADQGEALRGYHKLFLDHVTQAGEGCDFDYLTKRPYVARTP
jgi:dihydroxy-acid dehydratase